MTEGTREKARLFWLALGLSLAVHIGLAVHLLSRDAQDFGATDLPTSAISVNIESSDVLDAITESEAREAAFSPASTAGEPIPPQETEPEKAEITPPPPAETEKPETQPPIQTPPPPQTGVTEDEAEKEAVRRSELAAQQEQQRIAEEALQRAAEAEREQQAAEAERKRQAAEQRARDKARQLAEEQEAREEREARAEQQVTERKRTERAERARKKSGNQVSSAAASGSRGVKTAAGRVSASQGAVGNYSGIVNAWIARNKPSGAGARGRVVVELAISASGQLTFARIISSSGNSSLDQIALAAVRRSSPFPQPPPGSPPARLRFTFPFRFE